MVQSVQLPSSDIEPLLQFSNYIGILTEENRLHCTGDMTFFTNPHKLELQGIGHTLIVTNFAFSDLNAHPILHNSLRYLWSKHNAYDRLRLTRELRAHASLKYFIVIGKGFWRTHSFTLGGRYHCQLSSYRWHFCLHK